MKMRLASVLSMLLPASGCFFLTPFAVLNNHVLTVADTPVELAVSVDGRRMEFTITPSQGTGCIVPAKDASLRVNGVDATLTERGGGQDTGCQPIVFVLEEGQAAVDGATEVAFVLADSSGSRAFRTPPFYGEAPGAQVTPSAGLLPGEHVSVRVGQPGYGVVDTLTLLRVRALVSQWTCKVPNLLLAGDVFSCAAPVELNASPCETVHVSVMDMEVGALECGFAACSIDRHRHTQEVDVRWNCP